MACSYRRINFVLGRNTSLLLKRAAFSLISNSFMLLNRIFQVRFLLVELWISCRVIVTRRAVAMSLDELALL